MDDSPNYLGIILDPRLTWKGHIDKCFVKAVKRSILMRMINGPNWGADNKTLKFLFAGYVR